MWLQGALSRLRRRCRNVRNSIKSSVVFLSILSENVKQINWLNVNLSFLTRNSFRSSCGLFFSSSKTQLWILYSWHILLYSSTLVLVCSISAGSMTTSLQGKSLFEAKGRKYCDYDKIRHLHKSQRGRGLIIHALWQKKKGRLVTAYHMLPEQRCTSTWIYSVFMM